MQGPLSKVSQFPEKRRYSQGNDFPCTKFSCPSHGIVTVDGVEAVCMRRT